MASTYSNLKFELIATGEQSGAWGATTNTNIGTAIEQAVVGMATLETGDFSSNVATLTLSNTNALQDARALCLNITATLSAAGTVNVPAIEKPYIIINNSSGGYAVTVKVSGQTGISVPNGKRTVVYNNGTDVGNQIDYLSSLAIGGALTIGTPLAIASGGTGSSTAADARTALAVPGTAVANTFTATQTFNGSSTTIAEVLKNAAEPITVSATAATGTINFDLLTQSIVYYTSNASANWTTNLRGDGTTSMNTLLSTGQAVTMVFMVTQGSTAYYNNVVQVDGTTSGVTTKWQGGTAPTSGRANTVDVYTYTVIKTGSAAFTVLASQTSFG
jgi:hypothetical protein